MSQSTSPFVHGKPLKVLVAIMTYDYGVREQGFGYEYYNFHDALVRMGCEVLLFDFATLLQQHGRTAMNRLLRETVDREKPDILFCSLYKNEINRDVMRAITDETETTTLNWFCDDTFRFRGFSSRWARSFDWIFTVDKHCVPLYQKLGAAHAAYVRWACNPFLYTKSDAPPLYDVTFVGRSYGGRGAAIERLRQEGFSVRTWGRGWEGGRLSQAEMVEVFGRSRINLNFSDASVRPGWKGKLGLRFPKQIKGRLLEVPACGGFLLTGDAPLLPDYYTAGRDVAVFTSTDDLVAKVRYYLSHETERAAIARSGYERTLREHTYVHRFSTMFQDMGYTTESPEKVLAGSVAPGISREITLTVSEPVVSVVMAVYNGEAYVRQTIDSILAQQFQDFEFVIVDDGSTDSTLAILNDYAAKDPRVKLHCLAHAGKVTAFNTGFLHAKGKYIAFTGADDISLPERLTQQVNYLDEHPEIGCVGSWVELIDADGTPYGMLRHPSSPAVTAWSLCVRSPIAAPVAMFRRSVAESLGWCREIASEDYDLWSRMSMKTGLANIPKVLLQYRVWQGNFTSTHKPEQEEAVRQVMTGHAEFLLGEDVSPDAIRALRLPVEGVQTMTLDQVRLASSLLHRLHRAFVRRYPLSFRDAQQIKTMIAEYDVLLATHARKHSPLIAYVLSLGALLRHPLFILHVLRERKKNTRS